MGKSTFQTETSRPSLLNDSGVFEKKNLGTLEAFSKMRDFYYFKEEKKKQGAGSDAVLDQPLQGNANKDAV
jgi:hypothetical protein